MERIAKDTKAVIKSIDGGPFMQSFVGQQITAGEHMGASGETQLFNLTKGGGLFLRADQITISA